MPMPSRSALTTSTRIVLLLVAAVALRTHADSAGGPDDNAYLDKLQGSWEMAGTLGGKAVHYHANGERVLKGGFLRLHMIDAEPTPTYEADVFIGFDAQRHDFIAHWLDRFGAAGARVVASGRRASGAFRDTFTFMPQSDAWSLLLESQKPDGTWSTFATYTLTRPT